MATAILPVTAAMPAAANVTNPVASTLAKPALL
jgi:hypothetical protein